MARFSVTYWIGARDEDEARQRALDIALEQTVEIPRDAVPSGYVEDEILGKLESLRPGTDARGGFLAEISYSEDDIGEDFLQLLNIVFGNSSIKTNIRSRTSACRRPSFRFARTALRHGRASRTGRPHRWPAPDVGHQAGRCVDGGACEDRP